ncbi:type II secretion protein F [Microbacterium paludicola]|uniref:Type II secretion protein F n=1 Tax=Microbacterium paludicola TaxID=300019 RepID=A0A4Y9FRF2_9MICO|nr:type II secretion system F family protein [Microbacterium paludicola]MBF0817293.1 type II secretion system F family protein [Microbacterium paludicola]TFU31805.1 type II secretion protein F [Microbacterium paludicola]
MTVLWGALLGGGLLLLVSPWLWPASATRRSKAARDGALTRLLAGAGLSHVSERIVIVACIVCALLCGAIAWLATGVGTLALLALLAGSAVPIMWLRSRRSRLIRARRALWPDVCDLLIASVRAGMSLPDAIASLALSAPPALRPAFARFERDMSASGHFDSSADRLKSALADPMADRIVETMRMARQVGGTELVPVLRALSASVRADAALRAEVESRQSWTKGAAVLGVVAPWVILAMLALRPEGADAYSSPEGVILIIVGAVVSLVAYRVMIRIGRLPEPRRWFA